MAKKKTKKRILKSIRKLEKTITHFFESTGVKVR